MLLVFKSFFEKILPLKRPLYVKKGGGGVFTKTRQRKKMVEGNIDFLICLVPASAARGAFLK
jgi:hypothetical protein